MTGYLSPSNWKSLSQAKRREYFSSHYYLEGYADSDEFWDDQLMQTKYYRKKIKEAQKRAKVSMINV